MIATIPDPSGSRAAAMRMAFDDAFAAPAATIADPGENFLLIGIADDMLLLRLGEVAGLVAARRIAPVPSEDAALLGITGRRGAILPVYRLGAFLGYPPAVAAPRWLAVAAAAAVAFAVDRLHRQLAVPKGRIVPRDEPTARGHIHEAGRIGQRTHSIVSLSSVLATIASSQP